jgi:hypothetical protein
LKHFKFLLRDNIAVNDMQSCRTNYRMRLNYLNTFVLLMKKADFYNLFSRIRYVSNILVVRQNWFVNFWHATGKAVVRLNTKHF